MIDWMAERHDRKAFFVTRRHRQVTVEPAGEWAAEVEAPTGWVSERKAAVARGGGLAVEVLTNLPRPVGAGEVAGIYLGRRSIEAALGELTVYLGCELDTLGYPKAALFGFCVAVVAYDVQSVVKGRCGAPTARPRSRRGCRAITWRGSGRRCTRG